jgi:endogenous inhibitor of DNA gyrase (YacG/DUF329 family)
MENAMQKQIIEEDCPWCNVPVGTTEKWFPFCSRKCAEADARDARATEADKWAMRYEL